MARFIFRSLLSMLVIGFGFLSAEIAKRYVQLWAVTDNNDDLVGYATWQTLSYVFAVLGVIVFIWAYVTTRKDL